MRRLASSCALVMTVLALGCSDEPETRPDCVSLGECRPLYPEQSFDTVFQEILQPSCGENRACHSAEGRQGGLELAEPDRAYDLLLGHAGGRARVVPHDAACSELVVRTHDVGKSWSMPPGTPLSEGARCMIRMWVEQGALRR